MGRTGHPCDFGGAHGHDHLAGQLAIQVMTRLVDLGALGAQLLLRMRERAWVINGPRRRELVITGWRP